MAMGKSGCPTAEVSELGAEGAVGATSWRYYTPYRPDPAEALQALRAAVFARGEYVDLTGPPADALRQLARRFGQDPDDPEVRQQIDHNLRVQQAIETGD